MRPSGSQHPSNEQPPEAWEPLLRLVRLASRPVERFLRIEAASGVLLLLAAAAALVWANSRWSEGYERLWLTPVAVRVGPYTFERDFLWLVNDGLMVVFFFVVGMEIRRELHHGELSDWRRAALPAAAALGGMIAPAALYLSLAGDPHLRSGWGVPMATDIAFAVGVLALLGRRVPPALRVLLLALAVIDDLGAIIVIAIFYSSRIALAGFVVAALGFAGIFAMQRFGVRRKVAYIAPAIVAWAGVYSAGIHPTIAGVIVGLATPVRAWLGREGLVAGIQSQLHRLTAPMSSEELTQSLRALEAARREAVSPAESLIEALHPWVAYFIMPVFALANAGVRVSSTDFDPSSWRVLAAVAVGLVVGKPLGILFACWLSVRLRVGALPKGVSLRHLIVLGVVAGIGFTMSLFIAQLAFRDPHVLAAAKLGVLTASAAAGAIGLALGRLLLSSQVSGALASADEAESSTTS
ncbi:MAG: Na+/H+ antiporter NhaA [Deltaproteobacteria bacterium]|nr:Na+/H+ antiporter NhaA [Deltaproteobacteria bacterium]